MWYRFGRWLEYHSGAFAQAAAIFLVLGTFAFVAKGLIEGGARNVASDLREGDTWLFCTDLYDPFYSSCKHKVVIKGISEDYVSFSTESKETRDSMRVIRFLRWHRIDDRPHGEHRFEGESNE